MYLYPLPSLYACEKGRGVNRWGAGLRVKCVRKTEALNILKKSEVDMIYDDVLILEALLLMIMTAYLTTVNLTTLLFSAGLYLLVLGLLLLTNDADLYVGFLWVIDLGVGLVFFLFVVHFTAFMYQKSNLNLTDRHYVLAPVVISVCFITLYVGALGGLQSHYGDISNAWYFRITHLDYFTV